MDQFLERCNLPKLTQGETNDLNRPMSIKETELIINNLPNKKAPGPSRFTGKFYRTIKGEILPVLYNLFQKIEAEKILFNSVYDASIIIIIKPDTLQEKDTTKKSSHEHRCKSSS